LCYTGFSFAPARKASTHHVVRTFESTPLQFFKELNRIATTVVPPLPKKVCYLVSAARGSLECSFRKRRRVHETADRAAVQTQAPSNFSLCYSFQIQVLYLLIARVPTLPLILLPLRIARLSRFYLEMFGAGRCIAHLGKRRVLGGRLHNFSDLMGKPVDEATQDITKISQ
jgi:hypothetical protein